MRLCLIALLAPLLSACVTSPVSTAQRPGTHPVRFAPSASSYPPLSPVLANAQKTFGLTRAQRLEAQFLHQDDQESAGDLWSRIRGGFQMPDLENDLVQKWLSRYASHPDDVK